MPQFSNSAAVIPEAKGYPLSVVPVPYTAPGDKEVVIENKAWGINHIDYMIQLLALFPMEYPATVGQEVAGTIVQVGKGVSQFKVGDRVTAMSAKYVTNRESDGAFQLYTVVPQTIVSRIPDSLSFESAVAVPLAAATAAAGLFEPGTLELQLPEIGPVAPLNKTVLVWGGASSVGAAAIQFAVAAGYNVITTVSAQNFELAQKLGASQVFDYRSSTVTADVAAAVMAAPNYVGAFDAVNKFGAIGAAIEVVARLNNKKLITVSMVPKDLPEGVSPKHIVATVVIDSAVGTAIFKRYLPAALANGYYTTPTIVAGKGLEGIQAGIDILKKGGLSAKKVVVVG